MLASEIHKINTKDFTTLCFHWVRCSVI